MYIESLDDEDLLEDELMDLDWNYHEKKQLRNKCVILNDDKEIEENDE